MQPQIAQNVRERNVRLAGVADVLIAADFDFALDLPRCFVKFRHGQHVRVGQQNWNQIRR